MGTKAKPANSCNLRNKIQCW